MSKSFSLPKSDNVLYLAASIAVITAGLAVYGVIETCRETGTHWDLFKVLEMTLEAFESEPVVFVSGTKHELHWAYKLAQGLAKLLTLVVLGGGALAIFRSKFDVWRFRRQRNHSVFIGIGERGKSLALSAALKERVAAIDLDPANESKLLLQSQGALFLQGTGTDAVLLSKARVASARRVVILTANDNTNVHIAEKVFAVCTSDIRKREDETQHTQILVSVSSSEYRDLLRSRWKLLRRENSTQPDVKVIGFESVALRSLLLEIAVESVSTLNTFDRGMNVLVAGDDFFVEEFLKLAVSFLQISGASLPRFVVCTTGDNLAAEFSRRYPAVDQVARVEFVEEDPSEVAWAAGLDSQNFDVAVIALSTEGETLFVAERVLRSSRFTVEKVKALVKSLPSINLTPLEKMRVISAFEIGCKSAEFEDPSLQDMTEMQSLEKEAREHHESYLLKLKPAVRATKPDWSALPEAKKESNRWVVLHRKVKQEIWRRYDHLDRSTVLEHLATSEHMRWMGEKVMDGWQCGAEEDEFRRLHACIRPFSELPEEEQKKNRDLVAVALGLESPKEEKAQ